MRKLLFALILAATPMTFAMQAQDVAHSLITGPNQSNDYGGITPKEVSCSASFSIREGKLEAFITWGDTGGRFRANLDSPVKVLANANGVTTLQLSQFDEPTMTLTMKVKNRAITSLLIEGDDTFLGFIPRRFHVECDELQQFIPKSI